MCNMISCLVDRSGKVYAVDGIHSHTEIANKLGINEDKCLRYEFDIPAKRLIQDFNSNSAPFEAKQSHDQAALRFFNECCGTPQQLIAFVKRGNWDEAVLRRVLDDKASFDTARLAAQDEYNTQMAKSEAKYERADKASWSKYNRTNLKAGRAAEKECSSADREYDRATRAPYRALEKAEARFNRLTWAPNVPRDQIREARAAVSAASKEANAIERAARKIRDDRQRASEREYARIRREAAREQCTAERAADKPRAKVERAASKAHQRALRQVWIDIYSAEQGLTP